LIGWETQIHHRPFFFFPYIRFPTILLKYLSIISFFSFLAQSWYSSPFWYRHITIWSLVSINLVIHLFTLSSSVIIQRVSQSLLTFHITFSTFSSCQATGYFYHLQHFLLHF
jgi:hypothetical protein